MDGLCLGLGFDFEQQISTLGPPSGDAILMETGDFLLTEDGSRLLKE